MRDRCSSYDRRCKSKRRSDPSSEIDREIDSKIGYPTLVSDRPSGALEVDEVVRQAARDVDRTLIQWALSLSPLDRLRAALSSAASLQALRDARSKSR